MEEDDGVEFVEKVGDIVLAAGRTGRLGEKGDAEKMVSNIQHISKRLDVWETWKREGIERPKKSEMSDWKEMV